MTAKGKEIHWISLRAPRRVTLEYDAAGRTGRGLIRDISESGLFVVSAKKIRPGTVLRVRFRLPDETRDIESRVSVIWSRKGSGFGARFLDLDNTSRAWIKEYVVGTLSVPSRAAFRPRVRAA